MSVKIMTDTNSGITPAEAEEWGVALVSMPFMIDGTEYLEGRGLTHELLFEQMESDAQVSTSQPGMGEVMAMWDAILEDYEEIVYIPMTSGLSSSMSSARIMAEEYEGRVHVADNKRISVPMRQSVRDALFYAEGGMTGAQICERLEQEALYHSIYVCVDKLDYLKKGGRITPATALIAGALGIKPITAIRGGKLDACAKVRGMKQALGWMVKAIRKDYDKYKDAWARGKVKLMAAYSETHREVLESWLAQIQEAFPCIPIEHDPPPLSICCHTGPGALGVGICYAATDI